MFSKYQEKGLQCRASRRPLREETSPYSTRITPADRIPARCLPLNIRKDSHLTPVFKMCNEDRIWANIECKQTCKRKVFRHARELQSRADVLLYQMTAERFTSSGSDSDWAQTRNKWKRWFLPLLYVDSSAGVIYNEWRRLRKKNGQYATLR